MKLSLPNVPALVLVTGLCFTVGACSNGGSSDAQADDFAIRACTTQAVQPREGFNPQTASVNELTKLADTAMRRSNLADQAAELNDRWLLLSEVSAAIAVFAQQLIEVREQGTISLNMWDEYKSASNTYLAECKSAMKNVPGSLLETDSEVKALTG